MGDRQNHNQGERPTEEEQPKPDTVLEFQSSVVNAASIAEPITSRQHGRTSCRMCIEPLRVFLLLTFFHAIIYIDRGSMATNAVNGHDGKEEDSGGFRAELEMSNLQNGFLSSISMVGRLVGCPIAARVSRDISPLIVIGSGMVVWLLAMVCCGLSFDFYFLAVCRLMVGIGQAPLSTIGTIVIDDIAPEESVSTWFSIFEGAGPIGAAIGFFYGSIVGTHLSWQYAFYLQPIVAIPSVIYCFSLKPFDLKRASAQPQQSGPGSGASSWTDIKRLLTNLLFVVSIIGMSLHKGYVVCMEYWAARGFEAVFHEKGVDMTVAAVLLLSSLLGSFCGGRLLDKAFGSSISTSLYMCGGSLLVVSILSIPSSLALQSYVVFIVVFGVSFLFAFVPLGPVSAATLWAVPDELRSTSRGVSVLMQQIFGAIPAPALYGAIVDWTEKAESVETAHRVAIAATTLFVCGASVLFFYGAFIGADSVDSNTNRTTN